MGVPLLFTDAGGTTPDLILFPRAGLYVSNSLFLGDDVYLDDGPTLDFFATAPAVDTFGVTVSVTPVPVVFFATAPTLNVTEVNVSVDPVPVVFFATPPDLGGQDTVVPVVPVPVVFFATPPVSSGGQLIILVPSVRELPPLRLHLDIETPSGRHFRWGEDEPNPANVPSGLRFSDTMPGGFENQDATLPRKPGTDYDDLERLSTIRVLGAGGELAGEYRLERAPRVSGDQMSISPSAVGPQAFLEDDKTVTLVVIDRALERWRGAGITRQQALYAANYTPIEPSTEPDTETGGPGLKLALSGAWVAGKTPIVEAWYDAGARTKVAQLYFTPSYSTGTVNPANPEWTLGAHVQDGDGSGSVTSSIDHFPQTGPQVFGPSPPRRFAFVQWFFDNAFAGAGADGTDYVTWLRNVAVVGDHGLPVRTDGVTGGFFASDVVRHAVERFTPLNVTTESIGLSGFVIPHLAFHDSTTTAEIVRQASRFGLQDWAVWDDRTFWWHDRGAHGRKWRARVSPAQLEETGESTDRVWNSIVVAYTDVDGTTRTVGPPGSGADTEDPVLLDLDPDNPANKAGITRRDLLQIGTGTAASATEVGRQFLQRSKELDTSGRARFVGFVEDNRGVVHPYWVPRAGDTVVFVDAASTAERRIVRTEKDHASRTCSVDLDAPAEGLQALLERLGAVLVDLGFS